jgi:glycyl-tRNA synthetase beta subunit
MKEKKMAKISQKDTQALIDAGALTTDEVAKLQTEGLVASRRTSTKRFMKTGDKTWVSPQFYFQGLKGAVYSKDMTSLKTKVDALIEKMATSKPSTTKGNK